MANISIYDPRTMGKLVERMPKVQTFIKSTFFRNVETFDTQKIDVDFKKGNRQLAPFVHKKIGGVTIDNEGYETNTYEPPLVAPNKITTVDDILKRTPGESLYGGKSPNQRAVEKMQRDFTELDEMITRREEWMCCQALFAVYEDATEYIGISEVTLPEISNITEEISGAGIGGKIESVILGAIEAMSLTLNFRTVTNNAIKLHEPRQHNIDLRAAQQQKDTVKGTTEVVSVKHILVVTPKKLNPGKVATAAAAEVSGEYAVSYYATYIDGKKKLEIDPLNYIYYVNGKDYLADVRKALGK